MKTVNVILAVAVMAVFGSAAWANSLDPGGLSLNMPGEGLNAPYFSLGLPSYFVPANLVDTETYSFAGDIAGTATSTVYRDPSTSRLTFEYQFTVASSDVAQASFAAAPWVGVVISGAGADSTGHSTAAGQAPVWTNGDPMILTRAANSSLVIQWDADSHGTLLFGATSDYSANIWFSTDATAYQTSHTGLLDSGAVALANVLAPASPVPFVPEPVTMFGMLLGVGALGRYWSRKHRVA